MSGVELIAAERERQISEECWTPEHDDEHSLGQMRLAAKAYAASNLRASSPLPLGWPWHRRWWKPSDDPIRNLIKAGALIAAEIDRLSRS